jgi:hypothetical protein
MKISLFNLTKDDKMALRVNGKQNQDEINNVLI